MKPPSRASGCLPSGKVNFSCTFCADLACLNFFYYSLTEQLPFSSDFRRRFLSLLSYQFSTFHPSLALSILQNKNSKEETSSKTSLVTYNQVCLCVSQTWTYLALVFTALSSSELAAHFSPYDLKRLELYSRSMVDYHLIMDLVPAVARIYFLKQLGDVSLSAAQCVSFPFCHGFLF